MMKRVYLIGIIFFIFGSFFAKSQLQESYFFAPAPDINTDQSLEPAFKKARQQALETLLSLKKKTDKWMDVANNPDAFTQEATPQQKQYVQRITLNRPKIQKARDNIYQLQRCFEASRSLSTLSVCKTSLHNLKRARLKAFGQIITGS